MAGTASAPWGPWFSITTTKRCEKAGTPSRPTVARVVPVPGAGRVVVGGGLDGAGPGPPCAGEDPHDASASASAVARAAANAAGTTPTVAAAPS